MKENPCKNCSATMCCAPNAGNARPCSSWLNLWYENSEKACLICKSYPECRPFGETNVEHAKLVSGTLTPHICSVCRQVIFGECRRYSDGGVTKYLCKSCKSPKYAQRIPA